MHAVMFFFLFKEFYDQAYSKRTAKALSTANGHAKQNGELKGKENGTSPVVKGEQNGHVKENGYAKSNGALPKNGASAYYMNGTADLNYRPKAQ